MMIFRKLRKVLRKVSESFRKENHTLSVKDVLKLFESKNVGITERSIINYCHPNKYGVSLLDCFYDENERKYYITSESAEKAIEKVKARKIRMNQESERLSEAFRKASERFRTIRKKKKNLNKKIKLKNLNKNF
jgi:hypothetical protein